MILPALPLPLQLQYLPQGVPSNEESDKFSLDSFA